MGQSNPKHKYRPGEGWNESSFEKKDLGVPGDKKHNMTLAQPRKPKVSWAAFNTVWAAE